ncbi:hypothetical protein [Parapedobacter sp. DT-150]|uniref:hypothetical protein n=1 Tax=Parapedobacter sp. DT-150 TaxID=3396162 RepID=UPI003F1DD390
MEPQTPFPHRTYVSQETATSRIMWYKDHKKKHLDRVVSALNPNHQERIYFYYPKAAVILELFDTLMKIAGADGVRVYFGSYGKHGDPDNDGKLALVYAPTKNIAGVDTDIPDSFYMVHPQKGAISIAPQEAKILITNYLDTKRDKLTPTLCEDDIKEQLLETKQIFFNQCHIKEIRDEIDYQLNNQYGVSGIKIYIASYTNVPVQSEHGHRYCQRLTILFVFTDAKHEDHHLEGVDPRYPEKGVPFLGAQDTAFPIPPYPDKGSTL